MGAHAAAINTAEKKRERLSTVNHSMKEFF